MNVTVLYENKRNRNELKAAIENKGHDVTLAVSSDDFFKALEETIADTFVIDVRSWYRGSSIYEYFNVPAKLNDTPIVFLNIPDGFTSIEGRDAFPGDVTLEKDASFDEIAAVIG